MEEEEEEEEDKEKERQAEEEYDEEAEEEEDEDDIKKKETIEKIGLIQRTSRDEIEHLKFVFTKEELTTHYLCTIYDLVNGFYVDYRV
ncbi:hypothetical protein M8J77_018058 [Diaphorina citri]|nr:hypothetical protein M8J77_018058 [Diaphorina citri]